MTMRHMRRTLLAALALSTFLAAPLAGAQGAFPDRPIKLIVPYAAGGGTDLFARLTAQELSKQIGQPVIVDNRPGAAGMNAGAIVAKSPADGYTILVDQTSIATNPMLYDKVPFDVKKDLEPIILGVTLDNVLIASPAFPGRNTNELVAQAKAQPGALNYASTGIGSPQHLAMEVFKDRTGTNIQHVPYKGGSPGIVATSANEVQMFFISISTALPFIKSGKVKAIGSGGAKRSPLMPDVPTVGETLPGFLSTNWLAFFAPAGTPPAVVKKLNESFQKALAQPGLVDALRQQGMEVHGGAPSELTTAINRDMTYFGKVIKSANIKAE
ncbi:MAG: tripartite tricarboxylate transporter substrate binding protein [Comamonadaceae bacterium]|nr:MAG: tripartite tricarboxylate transporter substrate binding protein [Comamonadaceae bacterium]